MLNILRSRNFRNSVWNVADIFLYPVLFIITTPLFIERLGEKSFGVWMLVNSIMISMQVFNLGLGQATFRNVAAHLGLGEIKKVTETVNTNLSLSALVHLFCIVAGGMLAAGIRWFSVFNIEAEFRDLAAAGALMGGLIVGLKFYEQVISYTFKAFERFDIAAWFSTGTRLTVLGINCLLVLKGYGLLSLFLCTVLVSSAGIVVGLMVIRTQVKDYISAFSFNRDSIRKELHFAIWPWFQSLAIILTFQCDRFFVVSFLGLGVLSYYGLVATIFNHMHMGFSALVPWLTPKVAKLYAQGQDVQALYLSARNLCLLLALAGLLLFHLISAPLLTLVLGAETYTHIAVYVNYFTLAELFFIYAIVPNYFMNAAGQEKLYFKIVLGFCTAIITGMLCGYFITRTVEGLLSGMTIAMAASMIVQDLIIHSRVFSDKNLKQTLILFVPAILIAACIISAQPLLKYTLAVVSALSLFTVFMRYHPIDFRLIRHES